MKNILITGGAGFVGSSLAVSLARDNPTFKITALDNLHRRGSELNVPRLAENGVKFLHGDVRQINDLEAAGDVDLLIECSAEVSVSAGYKNSPAYLYQTNLFGTLNCLEICRRHQADIVFLSTSRVYPIHKINSLSYREEKTRIVPMEDQKVAGMSRTGISEDFSLSGTRTIYGATKFCSELMIQEYIDAYGIRGAINRCGVISGPWQMGKVEQGFVVLWMAKHLWGGELAYIGYGGTGKQVRDILHIADLYSLLRLQITSMDKINGQVFNVGGGLASSVSLYELTVMCEELTGNRLEISAIPGTAKTDIPYYVSDCTKAESMIGWEPVHRVRDILGEIRTWLIENEDILKGIVG